MNIRIGLYKIVKHLRRWYYCRMSTLKSVPIINSDFHSICATKRHSRVQKSKDVIIGNNVWLGTNVSICKGVYTGDNAIVANGAVMFEDVKENTIVRGNPAVYYKTIHE